MKLLAIGREIGGAAIKSKIAPLGIDKDRLAQTPRGLDKGAKSRLDDDALGVVGNHDDVGLRNGLFQRRNHGLTRLC